MFDLKRAFENNPYEGNTQSPADPQFQVGSVPDQPIQPVSPPANQTPPSSFQSWQQTRAQAPVAQPTEPETNFAGTPRPQPEEAILTWSAPSRPFKKRNKQFYTTVGIIVFLVSLILFFAGQFLPIAVVISVAFLSYVLSSVPPQEATYRITTYGIHVEENLYYWEEMGRFWFDEKYQQKMLNIEIARFPGRLTLMLGELNEADLEEILQEVLIKEKPADTFFDTSAKWLQEKIPLDHA